MLLLQRWLLLSAYEPRRVVLDTGRHERMHEYMNADTFTAPSTVILYSCILYIVFSNSLVLPQCHPFNKRHRTRLTAFDFSEHFESLDNTAQYNNPTRICSDMEASPFSTVDITTETSIPTQNGFKHVRRFTTKRKLVFRFVSRNKATCTPTCLAERKAPRDFSIPVFFLVFFVAILSPYR